MLEPDELAAWLRLVEAPGVGRESARRLLAAFGSPEAIFAASTAARRNVVGAAQASTLSASTDALQALVAGTRAWLDAQGAPPRDVLVLGDPRYPRALLNTADPPLLLYAEGVLERLQGDSIAIVGSRNPTPQGVENAHSFAAQLSRAGLTVVSGLALGIDGAAHAGALEGAAATIAVVGTGLDRVYPRRHADLARRIAAEGLLLSEYALGTPPLPDHFPARNRIIAGLSRGTLVVEAALQSGSLITARMALEAGREVFAIPGSIHSPQSRGCLALIKQGAKLVDSAEDILEELRWPALAGSPGTRVPPAERDADPGADAAAAPSGEARRASAESNSNSAHSADPLLAALGFDPISLDEMVARTGMGVAELNVRLLELELAGHVARLPGQRFQRVVRG